MGRRQDARWFRSVRIVLALVMTLLASSAASALEIQDVVDQQTDGIRCAQRLTGEIMAGDVAKVKAALAGKYGARVRPHRLCLDSKGGNFLEAIKIAYVLLEHRITTLLEPQKECLSACAVIFMAGTAVRTNGVFTSRLMHRSSRLAFHAPRPPVVDGKFDSAQAYDAAIEALGRQFLTLARYRERAWDTPLIKPALINEMMLTSGTRWHEVDTVARAVQYEITVLDTPQGPPLTLATVRNVCWHAAAEVLDGQAADAIFVQQRIRSYRAVRETKETDANAGRVGWRHQLGMDHKFSGCAVSASDGKASFYSDYHVTFSFGANTTPVVFAPMWYAFPPGQRLATLGSPEPISDEFCAKPESEAGRVVCQNIELVRYERLRRNFVRQVRAGDIRLSDDRRYSDDDERDFQVRLKECGQRYECINNAYVDELWSLSWGHSSGVQ